MSTPYTPPAAGTASLFPVVAYDVDGPDLAHAVNALYFDDQSRWPKSGTSGSDTAGSTVLLRTWLVDSPDGNEVANWLGVETKPSWFPGIPPQTAPATDAAGTVPYVNPANSSNPDAIYALNYLIDNIG